MGKIYKIMTNCCYAGKQEMAYRFSGYDATD
jgi:hypothetical protein